MYYAILTNLGEGGSPFLKPNTPPTAPGSPLRVSESATLIGFENQPDSVFARQSAAAYGKMLWSVNGVSLHPDDLSDAETFSSCREFDRWLFDRERQ